MLWGHDYRSAYPSVTGYSLMHLATLGMAVLAMIAGSRALFGALILIRCRNGIRGRSLKWAASVG